MLFLTSLGSRLRTTTTSTRTPSTPSPPPAPSSASGGWTGRRAGSLDHRAGRAARPACESRRQQSRRGRTVAKLISRIPYHLKLNTKSKTSHFGRSHSTAPFSSKRVENLNFRIEDLSNKFWYLIGSPIKRAGQAISYGIGVNGFYKRYSLILIAAHRAIGTRTRIYEFMNFKINR